MTVALSFDLAPVTAASTRVDGLALFLDLDGTLIDIAERPHLAFAPAGLTALLQRARVRLGGALAVLSGRTLAEIDALTAPLVLPAAGVHGAELRLSPLLPFTTAAAPLAPDFIAGVRAIAAGRLVEPKCYAVAVHYRDAPEEALRLDAELRALTRAAGAELEVLNGRMVIEIKSRGASKGEALRSFMRASPFLGRTPIMIGDDETDRTAMAAARDLGGEGRTVGGEHFGAVADFADPAAVRQWLANLAEGNAI